MTMTQVFAIERRQSIKLAHEAIRQCQWRLCRPRKEDPCDCATCARFTEKTCFFRKFLAHRKDERAWTPIDPKILAKETTWETT